MQTLARKHEAITGLRPGLDVAPVLSVPSYLGSFIAMDLRHGLVHRLHRTSQAPHLTTSVDDLMSFLHIYTEQKLQTNIL